jgi:hypothetical protein
MMGMRIKMCRVSPLVDGVSEVLVYKSTTITVKTNE